MPVIATVPQGEWNLLTTMPTSHKIPGAKGMIGKRDVVDLDALTAIASPSQNATTMTVSKILEFIINSVSFRAQPPLLAPLVGS